MSRRALAGGGGSSPRVRGKLASKLIPRLPARIIPASAGQTGHAPRRHTHPPDHPRECGANMTAVDMKASGTGSSPRVRGKQTVDDSPTSITRIIPASAGQTPYARAITVRMPDHPRECGANQVNDTKVGDKNGSSPRVRGKRPTGPSPRAARRIIPASAGQTRWWPSWPRWWPDHPRECGANNATGGYGRKIDGSSPRVRGKRVSRVVELMMSGSSPRVRGKRLVSGRAGHVHRIIPASAGQTSSNGVNSG